MAGGVSPETRGAGTPRRKRLAADFNSERNVSELEVYDDTASDFPGVGTFNLIAGASLSAIHDAAEAQVCRRMRPRMDEVE